MKSTVTGNPATLYKNSLQDDALNFSDETCFRLLNYLDLNSNIILLWYLVLVLAQGRIIRHGQVILHSYFEGITLSCKYESSGTRNYLHWYRQYPGSRPEYLLRKLSGSNVINYATPRFPQLETTENNKTVNLIISSAEVSDSALYYCALQPTVTGNPATLYKNILHAESHLFHKGSYQLDQNGHHSHWKETLLLTEVGHLLFLCITDVQLLFLSLSSDSTFACRRLIEDRVCSMWCWCSVLRKPCHCTHSSKALLFTQFLRTKFVPDPILVLLESHTYTFSPFSLNTIYVTSVIHLPQMHFSRHTWLLRLKCRC
uniref:Ig-like domain-containing protein n=1 Tax=Pygocentrus nattereri TaxID=42514 RepID=A0A3B4EFK7_PYGNA